MSFVNDETKMSLKENYKELDTFTNGIIFPILEHNIKMEPKDDQNLNELKMNNDYSFKTECLTSCPTYEQKESSDYLAPEQIKKGILRDSYL